MDHIIFSFTEGDIAQTAGTGSSLDGCTIFQDSSSGKMQTVTGQVVDLDLTGSADNSIISGIFCVVGKVGDIEIDVVEGHRRCTIVRESADIQSGTVSGENPGVGKSTGGNGTAIGGVESSTVVERTIGDNIGVDHGHSSVEGVTALPFTTEIESGIGQTDRVIFSHGEITEVLGTTEIKHGIIGRNDCRIIIHQNLTGLGIGTADRADFGIVQHQFRLRITIFVIAAVEQDVTELDRTVFHAESTGVVSEVILSSEQNIRVFTFTGGCTSDNVDTGIGTAVITAHHRVGFDHTADRGLGSARMIEGGSGDNFAINSVVATADVEILSINGHAFTELEAVQIDIIVIGTVGDGNTIFNVGDNVTGVGVAGENIGQVAFNNDFFGVVLRRHGIIEAAERVDTDEVTVDHRVFSRGGVLGSGINTALTGSEDGKVIAALGENVVVGKLISAVGKHIGKEYRIRTVNRNVDFGDIKIAVSDDVDQNVNAVNERCRVDGDIDDTVFSEADRSGGNGSVDGHIDNTFVDEFTVSLRIIDIPFPRDNIQRTAVDIQRTAVFHPAVVSINGDNAAFQNIGNAAFMDLQQFLPRIGVEQNDIAVNIRSAACNIEEAGVDRTAVFEGKFAAHTDDSGTAIENSTVFHNGSTVHIGLLDRKRTFQREVAESSDVAADVGITDQCTVFKADISSGKSTDIDRAFAGNVESTSFDSKLITGGNVGPVDNGDVVNAIS